MNHYKYKAKKIWLDTVTGQISYKSMSGNNVIRFDSKAEYDLYKNLKAIFVNYNCTIINQAPLWFNNYRWVVDFKIIVDDFRIMELLTIVWERYNPSSDYTKPILGNELFIEYKGVKNPEFINKQTNLAKCHNKDRLLLLTTPYGDAFYMDGEHKYNPYVKLMPSAYKLLQELKYALA